MEEMDLEEPTLYRVQCIKCKAFLSNPFKLSHDYKNNKDEIKVERYKGDNINYHAENDYNSGGKILYSFIYCLICHEKVGYWMSQASIKEKNNINHIFFFKKCVLLMKYDKSSVSEEEDRKFKQEEIFYNSEYLTDDVVNYAKAHIDNFIKNVDILEKQRNEAKYCYNSFERKIITLKELFSNNLKNEGKNSLKLGIDFSKEEISKAERRNKLRIRNANKNEEDEKNININGRNINNEENGNVIEYINDINDNEGDNGLNKNGANIIEINNDNKNIESEIDLDDRQKRKNNKEPSKSYKAHKKNKKKKEK